ncbi:MAG: SpoIIE family protein phosphatase [Candidatus Acidiferrales bacterium]|jgi:PAS domain S-box-containing protein
MDPKAVASHRIAQEVAWNRQIGTMTQGHNPVGVERPEWLEPVEGLLESLNEGVIITDDCNRILFVNSCFVEMIERPSEDLVGHVASDFYTPEEFAFILKQIERSVETGRNRFEFVLPLKDGSRLPVIVSSRRLEDPDGREFAIVTFTDISDQKSAEAQLRDANGRLELRQKEMDEDLALAARVQQSLAPKSMVWGGLRVDTYYHPVRSIGGDFGLVSPLDGEHLNLLVCDVSGHGIGSALVANRIYTETATQLRKGAPLGDMLQQLNKFVMQNIGGSVFFFTLAAARIERDGRRMVFAGAGHPPAMIVTPGEEPILLESRSMVLGALPEAVDVDGTLSADLHPGDRVVLYTDGITDVFDAQGEMLGVPGVQKFVREAALLPFHEMKQGILDRVAEWREGPPVDDVSLVLVEVL